MPHFCKSNFDCPRLAQDHKSKMGERHVLRMLNVLGNEVNHHVRNQCPQNNGPVRHLEEWLRQECGLGHFPTIHNKSLHFYPMSRKKFGALAIAANLNPQFQNNSCNYKYFSMIEKITKNAVDYTDHDRR